MLAPLRRCAASLPRALSSTALARPALRNTSIASLRPVFPSRIPSQLSVRAFQSGVRQAAASSLSSQDHAPITKFHELEERNIVHPNVIRALVNDMGLEAMTDVQSATIHQALQGTDLIAQAKTGTGKTVGFLLPMLQNIISKNPSLGERQRLQRGRRMPPDIRAIIISPTRELAEQIAVEARKLAAHTSVKVQTAVGGTGKRDGLRRIMMDGCHVLVATPGRLNDILSDEYSRISAPNLDYLIFDEADRLLETGFWDEIQSISRYLPDRSEKDRQTLMFSATVPKEVVSLVRKTLKPGFHFIKTVRDDEEPTHQRVPQKVVVTTGFETQLPALLELCKREAELSLSGQKRPFKSIVFFNSLKEVQLAYDLFREIRRNDRRRGALWQGDLFHIHSGLTQSSRQKVADSFKAASRAVMFSTNVTARGMDFPNVTHVIQVGLARDPADYIHRIGRTGRAGKEGEGWLLIPKFDTDTLRTKLRELPLKKDDSLATANADLNALEGLPDHAAKTIQDVQDGFKEVAPELLEETYPSIIAANGNVRDKEALLGSMQILATEIWGLQSAPSISPKLAQNIGLHKRSRPMRPSGGFRSGAGRDFRGGRDSRSTSRWEHRGSKGGSDKYTPGRPRDNRSGRDFVSQRPFDGPRGTLRSEEERRRRSSSRRDTRDVMW